MGGDHAPHATIDGALMAARELVDATVVLVGPADMLQAELKRRGNPPSITIQHAAEVITMGEPPAVAVRRKPDSSLVVGARLLAEGQVDAFVSAGSTGALVAAGLFVVGRMPGIDRPALAAALPGPKGPTLLLDVGAVVDCKPEWLLQFALMGAVYTEVVYGRSNPTVALLNIGTEAEKGNELTKAAHGLFASHEDLNFVGYLEPRSLLDSPVDVVVADGFAGNIALKTMEGVAGTLVSVLKGALTSGPMAMAGGLLARGALGRALKPYDYKEAGGAPFLGVKAPLFKCHGSSDAATIHNGILGAYRMALGGVVDRIRAKVAAETEET